MVAGVVRRVGGTRGRQRGVGEAQQEQRRDDPNSAMNAGNSIDCDIAAANGSCRNPAAAVTAPGRRRRIRRAPGSSAAIRDVMNAAMPALPSTAPT